MSERCDCGFNSLHTVMNCGNYKICIRDVQELVQSACNIPYRQVLTGLISWQEQEDLTVKIDEAIWRVFTNIPKSLIGRCSLLHYFQEETLKEVKKIMKEKNIFVTSMDESIFRGFKL